MSYSTLLELLQVALSFIVVVELFGAFLSYVRNGLSWRLPVIFVIMVLTVHGISCFTPSKVSLIRTDSNEWRSEYWLKSFVDASTDVAYDIKKGKEYVFLAGTDSVATLDLYPVYYSSRPSQFGKPVNNAKVVRQIPIRAHQLIELGGIDYFQSAPEAIETVEWGARTILRWVLTLDRSSIEFEPKYRRAEILYFPPEN